MSTAERAQVLVVGAGVAGLACAGALAEQGLRPIVLERARGVGGRCATRRVDGQPVDHGLAFLHGSDPEFVASLGAVDWARLDGWPARVRGAGLPCQPAAFEPGQRRTVFQAGVTAFPKCLARDLDVRLGQDVREVSARDGLLEVRTRDGGLYETRALVLALALEQARALLEPLAADREVHAVQRLLAMFATVPCLTVIAGYPRRTAGGDWDILYPEDSSVVQLISNDGAKRPPPARAVLVVQARPVWSRHRLHDDTATWAEALLTEAARLVGRWAGSPEWSQSHRWLHARLEPGSELAVPLLLDLAGGPRVGLAGELFSPGGGVQAAFVSGRRLAQRLSAKGDL